MRCHKTFCPAFYRLASGVIAGCVLAGWSCCIGIPAAIAGTTWDGEGVDTKFTTSANWNGDLVPTFTGGTSTLTFATGGSTATVDTAANLARIILNRDAAFTIADGSGSLTLAGETVGGVLTGITASPATAGTTVAYTISESIALGATQSWNVANNGAGGTSLSVSGVISGASLGLTKIGSGTLTLSGVNTFSGTMSINEGTVSVGSWNNASSNGVWGNAASLIQMNGGRINYTGASASGNLRGVNLASGTNTIDVASGATLNFAGTNIFQSNGGNLVKEGAGTLQLGSPGIANNIFTGKVTINSGTLDWFGGGSMPAPASLVSDFLTINDGAAFALSYNSNSTVNANIGVRLAGNATISSGSGGNPNIQGPIADGATAGSLQKTGLGTLTLSGSNSFTGSTRSVAGTLVVGNTSALAASTLDMNAADLGSITFSQDSTLGGITGSRNLDMSTRTLSIGNNGQSTTYSGVLSNGGLTKIGSGTLTLSGSNSYAGNTTISAGELIFGSNASQTLSGVISGTGSLTQLGSGTLVLSGNNSFSGLLTVANGALSINSWNSASTNGPLGNSAASVVLGSATSAGTLRYTGGNIDPPTAPRGIQLNAGGGIIQLGGSGRDSGRVHISGTSITGSGPLTINSPGMTRFLLTGGSSGFSGPVRVQAGELQGNVQYSSGTYTPFGTGSNGLGSAMTVDSGALLTLYGGNNYIGIRLGSLAGSGTVRAESGTYNLLVGGDGTSTTFSGVITSGNAFHLTKVGSGTLTLSGSNSYAGNTTISAGRLVLGGNGVLGSGSYAGTIANAGELVLGSDAAQILSGVISGTGSLTKSGAGTLTLLAANTYSGNTTLSAGRLVLGGNGVLGSGSYAGTIANAGELIFGSNASQTLSGVISGTGSLTQLGSGTLALSGNNSFSGLLTVANGALSINSWNDASTNGPLGNSAANVVLGSATSAGTLRYTGGNSNAPTTLRGIDLAAGGGVIQMAGTGRDSGYVHIAGSRISGSGQLTINSPGMTRFLIVGSSTFSGPVTVQAGELQINMDPTTTLGSGSNGLGSAVTVNSGALLSLYGFELNGRTLQIGSLAGAGIVRSEGGGTQILSVGGDGTSTTFSGAIGGGSGRNAIALTKVGSGKLTLAGVNTYTGTTSINAGELAVNGTIGGPVRVANAASLSGSGSINGLVSVAAGGILAPGNSPGTLAMAGGLSLDAASILNFELNAANTMAGGGINDLINVTGNFTLAGILNVTGLGDFSTVADNTKWRLFNYSGGSFTNSGLAIGSMPSVGSTGKYFEIDTATAGQVNLVIVPEPGGLLLAAGGVVGAAWLVRRRRAGPGGDRLERLRS